MKPGVLPEISDADALRVLGDTMLRKLDWSDFPYRPALAVAVVPVYLEIDHALQRESDPFWRGLVAFAIREKLRESTAADPSLLDQLHAARPRLPEGS